MVVLIAMAHPGVHVIAQLAAQFTVGVPAARLSPGILMENSAFIRH